MRPTTVLLLVFCVPEYWKHAFHDCMKLREVIFRGPDTTIAPHAFAECESLRTISGADFKVIPERVFTRCTRLSSFQWGPELHAIGPYAFLHSGLTSAFLPETVTEISEGTFADCCSLNEHHIPKDAFRGPGAFAGCPNVRDRSDRNIAEATMYGSTADVFYDLGSDIIPGDPPHVVPVKRDFLDSAEPVRITRVPAGIRLDEHCPEPGILLGDTPRLRMPLPTRQELTSEETCGSKHSHRQRILQWN